MTSTARRIGEGMENKGRSMERAESGPNPSETATSGVQATAPPVTGGSKPRSAPQVLAIALAAGVVAGLAAWLGGESAHDAFRPELIPTEVLGRSVMVPSRDTLKAAALKNGTLASAILGCATGLVLGFAGGVAGRAPARGVIVGLAALAVGALAAALASLALLPLFFRDIVPDTNDLLSPILIHGAIWMAIGAVGGLAFGIGMGPGWNCSRAIGAACVGAFLASVLSHLIGGGLFPDAGATEPVPRSSVVRLLGTMLVTVLVALGAARGALGRTKHASSRVAGH
jgi:hypothetical protein